MRNSYRRGALIVRRLCVLLGAEKIYREFSTILENEVDLDFASVMVQVGVQHFSLLPKCKYVI
jgi:hypothetical protein